MPAPYTGRCNCGSVTISIAAEPVTTRQCWCRQCQKVAAGGPTHNAIFPTEAVIVTGTPATSSYNAASGSVLTHEFCANCGTPVLARSEARPHFRTVRMGMLDEGHGLCPSVAIWTEEAPGWALMDPAMEQWSRQPPPPAYPAPDTTKPTPPST